MNSKRALVVGGAAALGALWLSSTGPANIRGKNCLITGGGSGVGKLTALAFAKKGVRVTLWDLTEQGMRETMEMIRREVPGADVHCRVVDVSDAESVYAAARDLNRELSSRGRGHLQILVNNAGIVSGRSLLETDDSRIKKTFGVNTLAHFWTVKAFLPTMLLRKDGHIVTIASVAGLTAAPQMVDYAASKHAAVGFASGLRKELKQMNASGICTSLICPAHIKTKLFAGFEQPFVKSLTPQYVASQIVDAVVRRREMVVLPALSDPRLLQAVLPTWVVDKLGQILGLDSAMKNVDLKQANSVISMIKKGDVSVGSKL